jgi:hypothetical protein
MDECVWRYRRSAGPQAADLRSGLASALTASSSALALSLSSCSDRFIICETRAQQRDRNSILSNRIALNAMRTGADRGSVKQITPSRLNCTAERRAGPRECLQVTQNRLWCLQHACHFKATTPSKFAFAWPSRQARWNIDGLFCPLLVFPAPFARNQ